MCNVDLRPCEKLDATPYFSHFKKWDDHVREIHNYNNEEAWKAWMFYLTKEQKQEIFDRLKEEGYK